MNKFRENPLRNSAGLLIAAALLALLIAVPRAALDLLIIAIVFGAYWTPSIVGKVRRVPNLGSVIVANFFGFALGIGWIVALAMAVRDVPVPVQERAR